MRPSDSLLLLLEGALAKHKARVRMRPSDLALLLLEGSLVNLKTLLALACLEAQPIPVDSHSWDRRRTQMCPLHLPVPLLSLVVLLVLVPIPLGLAAGCVVS